MLDRDALQALIPHKLGMCLLDEVVAWDDGRIQCRSRSHAAPDNPLRHGGRLRSVHLCEYGAQAMAVHGGLLARAQGGIARPGLLVSLRGVSLARAHVEDLDAALDVDAELLLASAASWQYRFRVCCGTLELADGRAAVMLLP